jgi:hypothetical protein
MELPSDSDPTYECGQCRSRYCHLHDGNPVFYDQGDDEEEEEPGHEYEHWDEDLEEDEQKIPKGCITCTKHPKYIHQRVFRDDEVTNFLLKHAKLKDYNEAIKFLKMELSVKTKEKEKEETEEHVDDFPYTTELEKILKSNETTEHTERLSKMFMGKIKLKDKTREIRGLSRPLTKEDQELEDSI